MVHVQIKRMSNGILSIDIRFLCIILTKNNKTVKKERKEWGACQSENFRGIRDGTVYQMDLLPNEKIPKKNRGIMMDNNTF